VISLQLILITRSNSQKILIAPHAIERGVECLMFLVGPACSGSTTVRTNKQRGLVFINIIVVIPEDFPRLKQDGANILSIARLRTLGLVARSGLFLGGWIQSFGFCVLRRRQTVSMLRGCMSLETH
jgi:hypothetical protein